MNPTQPHDYTADKLPLQLKAHISHIQPGGLSVKLLQMGCLPGKEIELVRKSLFGNPLYMRVGNQFLALRTEEAAQIILQPAQTPL